jgi:hypothetical protein
MLCYNSLRIYYFFDIGRLFLISYCSSSGLIFLILTATSDFEHATNRIFLARFSARNASYGAFLARILFSVLGKGFKLVIVVFGA